MRDIDTDDAEFDAVTLAKRTSYGVRLEEGFTSFDNNDPADYWTPDIMEED